MFNQEGEFMLKFGSNGEGNGQFNAPTGVAVDSNGNIIVADWGNSRIQVDGFICLEWSLFVESEVPQPGMFSICSLVRWLGCKQSNQKCQTKEGGIETSQPRVLWANQGAFPSRSENSSVRQLNLMMDGFFSGKGSRL